MSNREVHKLRSTGPEALYCFYTIGQCITILYQKGYYTNAERSKYQWIVVACDVSNMWHCKLKKQFGTSKCWH